MAIFVNQVGYFKGKTKHCTIADSTSYTLYNSKDEAVLSGSATTAFDENSGTNAAYIDFTNVNECGNYYFIDREGNKSCTFTISENPFTEVFRDACRMFYFQRCGIALEEKYAGKFSHKACHTANVSLLSNPSKIFECCGGWHDAGDYGRYTTAGAVAVAHLLYAFEASKDAFINLDLNIPESGNGTPDILNEVRYELEWFLKMQDEDGGVHHKCTSIRHTGFMMPEDDPLPFIVTDVSSLAVADFVGACMAASRIYAPYDAEFSGKLRAAADKSFEWLVKNPDFLFVNPKECTTGTYEDLCDLDERFWAAAEYYRETQDERALRIIRSVLNLKFNTTALGWGDVGGFGSLAILGAPKGVFSDDIVKNIHQNWLEEADRLVSVANSNGYELAFHTFNFRWGSNMDVLNNSIVLSVAHKLSGEAKYLDACITQIDYILGRNALDTSYVTGHGEKAFRNPHNRPTVSDGIDEPIPGFVSGGPNRFPGDPAACELIPKGTAPMKCFADVWGSYSTNEITIYWNSPLVFTLAYFMTIC